MQTVPVGRLSTTPDSYTETLIRFLVEMKLFRSQWCTKQKIVFFYDLWCSLRRKLVLNPWLIIPCAVNSFEISFGHPLCRCGVAIECHEVTRCTNFHQFFLLHAVYLFPSPFYLTYVICLLLCSAILRSKAALFMDVDHGPRRVEYKFTSSPGFSHRHHSAYV